MIEEIEKYSAITAIQIDATRRYERILYPDFYQAKEEFDKMIEEIITLKELANKYSLLCDFDLVCDEVLFI